MSESMVRWAEAASRSRGLALFFEQVHDELRELSQTGQGAEEPAVGKAALADIIGLNAALEDVEGAAHKVAGTAPSYRLAVMHGLVALVLGVQGALRRGKVRVKERDFVHGTPKTRSGGEEGRLNELLVCGVWSGVCE